LIWAAGDMQARGFLLGGTAGRTTLAGEGLQHQDGQSHIYAYAVPNCRAYDPAFAYELAAIIKDGMHRMFEKQENIFYYLTVMNEFYKMPPMPKGVEEGIIKGIYRFSKSESKSKVRAHLMGSGSLLNEAIKAQGILQDKYDVAADVWSVTSYKQLYHDAIDTQRWNLLNPDKTPKVPYVTQTLKNESGVFVAANDYLKALPASIAQWIPGPFAMLGTDGYGRSETRKALRNFFEVDARYIALAALYELAEQGTIKRDVVKKALKDMEIDPKKLNPLFD
jgi:pyruvate dehydrogenase E1 component